MMAVAGFLFCSCEEHVEPIDYSLKTGNIYCADGAIIPPAQARDEAREAVGIVVRVGGDEDEFAAIVMAMRDLGQAQYADSLYSVSSVSTDLHAFNGKHNTAALLNEAVEEERLNPMAAYMAASYNAGGITGWHLPSVAELKAAATPTVRASLELMDGEALQDGWYTTSTQDGTTSETDVNYNYCISITEGRIVSAVKTERHRVRPFLVIH